MNPALLDGFPGPVCPILLVVALPFVSVDVPERMSPWFNGMGDDDKGNVPSLTFDLFFFPRLNKHLSKVVILLKW